MDLKRVELTGVVARQRHNVASKSEREALVLEAVDGSTYVLRERGANPFDADGLSSTIGHSISVKGIASTNGTLIVEQWSFTNDEGNEKPER